MEGTQAIQRQQRHSGRAIFFVVIVAVLLIGAAAAFMLYGSNNGSASAHTQFKDTMLQIKKMGDDYAEKDMKLQSQYYYGIAGSSISAMRFAIDNLLAMKGEGEALVDTVDSSYQDWDSIAAVSFASPYPYYFEGLIYHIQGDESKAEEAYKNAFFNPNFPESGISFYYLNELSISELSDIRDELYIMETDIYNLFTPEMYGLERHPMNYNDEYLRAKAKELLELEPHNYSEAQKYYYAALRTNPFEAKNFACCAVIAIFNEDIDAAICYVNEGLWVDEHNEELHQLAAWLTQNEE